VAIKYYLRSQDTDATCDAGANDADYDLDAAVGSGPNGDQSSDYNNSTWVEAWTFDIDVSSGVTKSTGDHSVSVEISAITAAPGVRWRIQEISSGCAVLNSSSYTGEYTSAGVKTDTLNLTWSTGVRLRLSVEMRRNTGHSKSRATLSLEDADSFVNTPWTVAGIDYTSVKDEDENIDEAVLTVAEVVTQIDSAENIDDALVVLSAYVSQADNAENIDEVVLNLKSTFSLTDSDVTLVEAIVALSAYASQVDKDVHLVEAVLTLAGYVAQTDADESLVELVLALSNYATVKDATESIDESTIALGDLNQVDDDAENIGEEVVSLKGTGGTNYKSVIDNDESLNEVLLALAAYVSQIDSTENIDESVLLAGDIAKVAGDTESLDESTVALGDLVNVDDDAENIGEDVVSLKSTGGIDYDSVADSAENIGEAVISVAALVAIANRQETIGETALGFGALTKALSESENITEGVIAVGDLLALFGETCSIVESVVTSFSSLLPSTGPAPDDGWERPDPVGSPWESIITAESEYAGRGLTDTEYFTQDPAQQQWNQFIPTWDFSEDKDWALTGNATITSGHLKLRTVSFGSGTTTSGHAQVLMLPTVVGDRYTLKCRIYGGSAYDQDNEWDKLSCKLNWSGGGVNALLVRKFAGYQEFTLLKDWMAPSNQLQIRFDNVPYSFQPALWISEWWVDWVSMKLAVEEAGQDDPTEYTPADGASTVWS